MTEPTQTRLGTLYGVGLGPGDPELITLKAARLISAAAVVAYHQAPGKRSIAATIAHDLIPASAERLVLEYPVTVGKSDHPDGYRGAMTDFYAECANRIADILRAGTDVVVISEGDPMTYSSYQHLHRRLSGDFPTVVVPGVTSYNAAAAALGEPLVERDQVLSIIPGTLPHSEILQHLVRSDAAVVMKLGRNGVVVQQAITDANLIDRAKLAERVGHSTQRLTTLASVDAAALPYMSIAVVPGQDPRITPTSGEAHSAGRVTGGQVTVVGLGPGPDEWLTPAARAALDQASDIVGYQSYVMRVPARPGLVRHSSDNTEELQRARHALELARAGKRVCVVSSGDPGVFAMATAVFEAADEGNYHDVDIVVEPGVTAAQAAAARVGAPLGHDFAVISLSDRLKPWPVIRSRLHACITQQMAVAIYNPASRTRRQHIHDVAALCREHLPGDVPIVVARNVGRPGEAISIATVDTFDPELVDASTVVIVGTVNTRTRISPNGQPQIYTWRQHADPTSSGNGENVANTA